jgi:hypothetical protein
VSPGEASPDQTTPAIGVDRVYTLGPITPSSSILIGLKSRIREMMSEAARTYVLCQIIPATKLKCDTTETRSVSNESRELLAGGQHVRRHMINTLRESGPLSRLFTAAIGPYARSSASGSHRCSRWTSSFFLLVGGRLPCAGCAEQFKDRQETSGTAHGDPRWLLRASGYHR